MYIFLISYNKAQVYSVLCVLMSCLTFLDMTLLLDGQVCDEPHPVLIKDMLQHCITGNLEEAYKVMAHLWKLGYSSEDIITIVFRVCKNHNMPEFLKLEFIKVLISLE